MATERNSYRTGLLAYGISVAGILLATILLDSIGGNINATTVALSLLLIVLSAATFFGRNPALLASFVAMLCFNYFFLPPVGTWHVADSQNLVAWAAFTITALVAGELSAYARRRARESERLFEELQAAFETTTQAEAVRQSEKLKSALLDAVTHELRTPLTSIKASVTTLLDSEGGHRTIELDSGGRGEFLEIINEETDRLNGIIEGMVELARVEAGVGLGEGTLSSVEEIITIALEQAEPAVRDHRVTVAIPDDLTLIRVDPKAVAKVVYNLIENAAKYSPPQTSIDIRAHADVEDLFISITDQGRGIPPEDRTRVFDKFVRLNPGKTDGLGLGLVIARDIIESQGGNIRIEDGENGVGTRFILTFPLRD